MSNITQEIVFPGSGLDWDSDQNFIDSGSSPYRLNIMVSGDEANGIITSLMGNSLSIDITDHNLSLSRTYVTIASYYNRLTRKAYYWVFSQPYDSGGGVYIYDNRLFQFNEDEKTLDLIFLDTKNYFGLSLDSTFKDSSMLGEWLFFNPRVSEPKMIDVLRAFNYTNYDAWSSTGVYVFGDKKTFYGGLFVANTSTTAGQSPITHPTKWIRVGDSYMDDSNLAFDSEFEYAFNVLKMPPVIRPVVSYGSNTKIQVNNVRGKIFRFSYRYKYFDNSYSSYSAFSDVTLPENDELYNGEILNEITTNNYIRIKFNPHSPALVKEVECVVQEISGDWKRVKIINRQEQAELANFDMSFDFYNNESYVTVTNVEVAKVIDYVPRRTNSQEIINKNILAYGGCLEGFDNIPKEDIRVGLTPVLQAVDPAVIMPGITRRDNTITGDISVRTSTNHDGQYIMGTQIDMSWFPGSVVAGDVYIVTIDGHTEIYTIIPTEVGTPAILIDNLIVFFNTYFPSFDTNNSLGALYINIWSPYGSSNYAHVTQSLFCSIGGVSSSIAKKKGFKTGANHPFCIYYYDENMRRWDAQVSKENLHIFGLEMHGTTVYVPMFNEVSPPADTAHRWLIDWGVYHLPPEGAKYWRWGYAGNSLCSNMVQYIIGADGVANTDPAVDGANMCKIDITPLQTLKSTIETNWNQFPTSVIDPYEWKQGDRIRFITKESVPGAGTDNGDPVDGVYEYEILKQAGDDLEFIYIQGSVATNGITAAGIGVNSLVEIYTPLKSISDTKTIYYEFGDLMPIIEDSAGIMVHAGQNGFHNQDSALSHAALGTFDGGDVYHIIRTPSKPIDTTSLTKGFFHESMWYSDFYTSNSYDRGKIGIETSFGERFLNIVRYSRPFFQNTNINGLSTFEEDDANGWPGYKEYNDVFGNIVSIYEQGDTLKVYQERKASSTLIGRTEYQDSNGASVVAISTVILGAIRYSASNYSTIFPESISRNNKFLYGFDILNGVVWRDGVNGLFPISGRYAEAGGDADYKMQTYFKLKSKALMESGMNHVSILGVWDEEYKCYYLIFKDSVIQANNETIVFHEPSNRWITFVDMNQTPLNGFNTPLELTYEIVKGFENGIGYSFNEETRFAHFNIGGGFGTTAQTPISAGDIIMRITIPTPSISSSPNVNPAGISLIPSCISPSLIHVSWIALSNNSMTWTAIEEGINHGKNTLITLVGGGAARLTSLPEWITVSDVHPLSINDPISDGDILIVYPSFYNSSVQRNSVIDITDIFGNIAHISVEQDAPILDPSVVVSINPLEQMGLVMLKGSGVCHVNTTGVNIIFTIDNPVKTSGSKYVVFWVITRNGITDTNGEFDIQDEISNSMSIFLSTISNAGENIIVYLSSHAYGAPNDIRNVSIYSNILPISLSLPTPSVMVSWITMDNSSMSWAALDSGVISKLIATITCVGTTSARLQSFPAWLTVYDETRGVVLSVGDSANNLDVLNVYPIYVNDGTARSGDIIFVDSFGNASDIFVTQLGSTAYINILVQMNPSDISGTAISGTGNMTSGTRYFSIIFTPIVPSLGWLTQFNMNYQIWKNNWQVGDGTIYNIQNRTSTTRFFTMANDAQLGDIIIIYFTKI